MQFEPDPRLLEILVGSNLYADPDVSVRELVQNSRDAIVLRNKLDHIDPRIDVRVKQSERWFEVQDNGIGMNAAEIEQSLLQIGADKRDVIQGVNAQEDQIALFGIGFLSVFLVAASVSVRTRRHTSEGGLQLQITDLRTPVVLQEAPIDLVGTTVRVQVREELEFSTEFVSNALERHVRHVPFVYFTDVDSGTVKRLDEQWRIEGLRSITNISQAAGVRAGKIGFQETLSQENGVISNAYTLCNSGFLVEERALDLLPIPPLGFSGELDLTPSALNVVIARERFQRDEKWRQLGEATAEQMIVAARQVLRDGFLSAESMNESELARMLLLWAALLPDEDPWQRLRAELDERLFQAVPFEFAERRPTTLASVTPQLPNRRLYFRGGVPTQLQSSINDEGLPIHFTEEIRDSVRIGALRARGYEVMEIRRLIYTEQTAQGAVRREVQVNTVMERLLNARGFGLKSINEAPDDDMDLTSVERLPLVNPFLSSTGSIRFAEIVDSKRRVVRDSAGIRYLNVRNETIRRLLQVIPSAVGNPLRGRLLEIYVALESFDLSGAREHVMSLLESKEWGLLAEVDSAPLSRSAIERAVAGLLASEGG